MSMRDRVVKILNGHIVGEKTNLRISVSQKSVLSQNTDWCILSLESNQSAILQKESGIFVKEIFVKIIKNDETAIPLNFESIQQNLGVIVDSEFIEVAHKNLNTNADFTQHKKLMDMEPGSKLTIAHFVPSVESNNKLLEASGIEDPRERIIAYDSKTIGNENWILDKYSREFDYLDYSNSESRADFAISYNLFLSEKEFASIYSKRKQNISEAIINGTFFQNMCFIPYSIRFSFALEWWKKKSPIYGSEYSNNSVLVKKWIKESLLDAQELYYKCIEFKSMENESKFELFYAKRNIFHQLIVLNEKETEEMGLRDIIVDKD